MKLRRAQGKSRRATGPRARRRVRRIAVGVVPVAALALSAPAHAGVLVSPNSATRTAGSAESAGMRLLGTANAQVVNANSNKCLDVAGWNTQDWARVQQWDCTGGANQRWTLVDVGSGHFELVNSNSNKCADVAGWNKENWAVVQQWTCHGGANQQWSLVDMGGSRFELVNVNSNKCMDVAGWNKESWATIQQWDCTGGANQQWSFV
ncbi:hypothetical protein GCM10010357_22470 [Streptomyces luteireticuli]|uniref:Ricin B lectin domain-containing protein n=1 Tax=Streptomyces luteireticuli TaxID=173858 RepID=A0ABP3IHQ8_9ACTN